MTLLKKFFLAATVLLTTFIMVACNNTESEETKVAVTSIVLNKTDVEAEKGERIILTATVSPSNATSKTVSWISSNTDIASVQDGVVTISGSATSGSFVAIVATADGKSATCTVKIVDSEIAITSISLNKTSLSLKAGESETLSATISPNTASSKTIYWTSSNTSVATVSDGVVTIKNTAAAGNMATITASIDGKSASCVVTVKAAINPSAKPLTKSNAALILGDDWRTKTSIIIPEDITSIGDSVFEGNTNLIEVMILQNVIEIGERAFYGCENLEIVTFIDNTTFQEGSGNIQKIGKEAFSCTYYSDGNKISSITIPASVTEIEEGAFYNCTKLKSLTFAEGSQLEIIGKEAFSSESGNDEITSLFIPASVKEIGERAFYEFYNLETITFAEGSQLEVIGKEAFSDALITTLTIPASVKEIGEQAFYYCSELETLIFADGSQLETIGEEAFGYSNITTLSIPASVKEIGERAFSGSKITEISIPASVMEMDNAFRGCYSLSSINVDSLNANYASADGILYNKNLTKLIFCPYAYPNTSILIPASVTEIGEEAFYHCTNLESVIFTEGSQLKTIGARAFSGFYNSSSYTSNKIAEITIPASITEIGEEAFYCCENLESVIFAEESQLKTIGARAFAGYYYRSDSVYKKYYNKITEITIPANVTEIGKELFVNCSSLKTVTVKATTPPTVTVGAGMFSYGSEPETIYVPSQSVDEYKISSIWKAYEYIIKPIPE